MKSTPYKNRAFGCIVLKSVNSNFNADFTHSPRTLPDGTVYATDKALKYAIRDYFRKYHTDEMLFYVKRLNENLNPKDLVETYEGLFCKENGNELKDHDKEQILKNLLTCLDVRLFGATFAPQGYDKKNISIHGPVQINHGINRLVDESGKVVNDIYSEQIMAPFRTSKNEWEEGEKGASTLGSQTNIQEAHYVYHFSINPKNTEELYDRTNQEGESVYLSSSDIENLKEALNQSVTLLDSSRKVGTENEVTVFVELVEGSKKVLSSFSEMIEIRREGLDSVINFTKLSELLKTIEDEIKVVEVFYNPLLTRIDGLEPNKQVRHFNLLNKQAI